MCQAMLLAGRLYALEVNSFANYSSANPKVANSSAIDMKSFSKTFKNKFKVIQVGWRPAKN